MIGIHPSTKCRNVSPLKNCRAHKRIFSQNSEDAETNLLESGGAGGGGGDELLGEGDDLLQVRLQLDQFLHRNISSQKSHFRTFAQ